MTMVKNPILTGMHPDPSLIRVEKDYYIAVSTFEWFPGVEIYHSENLVNWKLVSRPLNRISQLDMTGVPDSGGVWAPCLSYCDGIFYLVYSNVKSIYGFFKDTPNYLVTCDRIDGDWSDPVYLNASGFDASLFHDTDGRKWLVNMVNDFRPWKGTSGFGGIELQEYSCKEKKLIGRKQIIFRGSSLGVTEGPHLYHIGDYYYLITAEGGTGYDHAVTVARATKLEGPYTLSPHHPLLTSAGHRELPLQKAGHASLTDTDDGRWYAAHLCGRPITEHSRCVLGRETCLQEIVWTADGWPTLKGGGNFPRDMIEVPSNAVQERSHKAHYRFEDETLPFEFRTLRVPLTKQDYSLTERPGYLRLYGGESLCSRFHQTMTAFRQEDFSFIAKTVLEFYPDNFQKTAGIVHYYDTINFLYLFLSWDEDRGRILNVLRNRLREQSYPLEGGINLPPEGKIYLKIEVHMEHSTLSYSLEDTEYIPVYTDDISYLSDDAYSEIGEYRFTGAHIGLCCQDTTGERTPADFGMFYYEGIADTVE